VSGLIVNPNVAMLGFTMELFTPTYRKHWGQVLPLAHDQKARPDPRAEAAPINWG